VAELSFPRTVTDRNACTGRAGRYVMGSRPVKRPCRPVVPRMVAAYSTTTRTMRPRCLPLPTSTVRRPKTCRVTVTWALATVLTDTLSTRADGNISAVTAIDGWLVAIGVGVALIG